MNTVLIVGIAIVGIFILLRLPKKIVRFFGNGTIRLTIGVLLLFFINVFGGTFGLHIPINVFTVAVSGLLGVPGIASLTAIHLYVIT